MGRALEFSNMISLVYLYLKPV